MELTCLDVIVKILAHKSANDIWTKGIAAESVQWQALNVDRATSVGLVTAKDTWTMDGPVTKLKLLDLTAADVLAQIAKLKHTSTWVTHVSSVLGGELMSLDVDVKKLALKYANNIWMLDIPVKSVSWLDWNAWHAMNAAAAHARNTKMQDGAVSKLKWLAWIAQAVIALIVQLQHTLPQDTIVLL